MNEKIRAGGRGGNETRGRAGDGFRAVHSVGAVFPPGPGLNEVKACSRRSRVGLGGWRGAQPCLSESTETG